MSEVPRAQAPPNEAQTKAPSGTWAAFQSWLVRKRRRTLWLGFLAVLVPLAVLLGLQYRWLVELEAKTAATRRMSLGKSLEFVTKEVKGFYKDAELTLDVPPSVFTPEKIKKAGYYFRKQPFPGARRIFLVIYPDDGPGRIFYYDPASETWPGPSSEAESRAVEVAVAPWEILRRKDGHLEISRLSRDERDPEHRILLYPITDDLSRLMGLAGMVVDEGYFLHQVLAPVIEESLPVFAEQGNLAVCVRDGKRRPLLPGDGCEKRKDEVTAWLPLLFTDWQIGLRDRDSTADEWARTNFAVNVSLSLALGLVLLAGVGLALRTASREIKLSEMKSEFVSNVSHELRTPISSIRVFGELMRLGRVRDRRKIEEYGEYIETESRRLTQLIDNILDFSRIESGGKTYRFEEVEVEELVEGAVKTLQVRLEKGGFTLEVESPRDPLPPVVLDPGAVSQALVNLLDNAIKYSNGGRHLRVALTQDGDRVVIAVTDQGIGISREEQRKIFDRFHRVSTGLVHEVRGSGLGLALVQHIARAHGGEVTVESELGKGSTFRLFLPVAGPDLAEEASAPHGSGSQTLRDLPEEVT